MKYKIEEQYPDDNIIKPTDFITNGTNEIIATPLELEQIIKSVEKTQEYLRRSEK